MTKKYIRVGKLLKPVGTQGEIKIDLDDVFFDDFMSSDHFFIKKNGNYVPYFTEDIRETNYLLLKIEDVDTPEDASDFNLKEVYLTEKKIQSKTYTKNKDLLDLAGYTMCNGNLPIGIIVDIEMFPHQTMAWVQHSAKRVAIPLAEAWIIGMDHEKKELYMSLPEGLLDL